MVHVIDNVIPLNYQDGILRMFHEYEFKWRVNTENVSQYAIDGRPDTGTAYSAHTLDTVQMVTLLYDYKEGVKCDRFMYFLPLIHAAENATGLPLDKLVRAKINILTPNPSATEQSHCVPHVDFKNPNISMIYYPNDSDGDTLIFNEKFPTAPEQVTIMQRVEPKKGRLLVFDGLNYHAGCNPTQHQQRWVVNFCFV